MRGSDTTSYEYDNLGQLTRINDQRANETWPFDYDRGGNVLSKSRFAYTAGTLGTALETIAYTYDATWKDKLASYNGNAITYDTIGNPLTYDGWTFAWRAGRQLASMSKTGTSASFDYNADGLRVRKTVNGTVTDYTLHGKQIVHMKQGSNNLHFFYDAQGRPSIVDFNGTKYGYIHNLQGDIIAIIDGSGTQVVEYCYDAWGKPLTKTGILAKPLGTISPFRYRGYVFDEETGLYYLRSRYYNPVWGRFVNADSVLGESGGLLSHNVFSYCKNAPITNYDFDGRESGSVLLKDKIRQTTGITPTDEEIALILLYPKDVLLVKNCARTADEWTTKLFPNWIDGDRGNAYRHALWNALLKQSFWSGWKAKMWTDAHEAWPDAVLDVEFWNGHYSREHREMDLYNNDIGIQSIQWYEFWVSTQEISDRILEQ